MFFSSDADSAGAEAMNDVEAGFDGRGITLFCCRPQPEVEIYSCAAFRTICPSPGKTRATTVG